MSRLPLAIGAIVLLAGCASRVARSSGDEQRSSAAAPPHDAPAPTEPPAVEPAPSPPPPPQPRLAWVNPARCATPCTYEPQADLVHVDDQGVAAAAGAHLVHRTIEEPVRALVRAAREAGHKIRIESAFRSYDRQAELFRQTKQRGRAARPGHSEHQLGTAVDFRVATTAGLAWLAEHAPAHGFALSYPDNKQRITGYRPEPWHARYVGPDLAAELQSRGETLEEMFRSRPERAESGSCDDCPLPASRAPCGAATETGTCRGTVLEWCFDGALASVDCAASKQRCGRDATAQRYDCLGK
jgi:zinc D-Ala-D-Ala carboxypeptidase